ncbi:MAG: tetratricopeptide repeat protein, partial [Magnetococcales bacterium]|nr:tetratricopeptide repeat protein [Magnetococcales bacterium]
WYHLGALMQQQKRLNEAVDYYRQAVALQPDATNIVTQLIHTEQQLCDWRSLGHLRQLLIEPALAWSASPTTTPPPLFPFLSIPDIAETELLPLARANARHKLRHIQPLPPPLPLWERGTGGEGGQKLRLGYLSYDFRDHPVAHQTLGIFKRHDRRRFEVFAYSSGPDDGSRHRQRIEQGVDHFVDIRQLSDQEAAQRIRSDAIDILIDLNGPTSGLRLEILAYRPAAVQVVHGASLGADCIDYLLADRFFIPPERQACYHEKVIYLPHSIMATDNEQAIATTTEARTAHGLPEQGLVFCSFSNHYKIEPRVFAVWMALLREIPNSVLWLADGTGRVNLQRAAAEHGVSPQRLVFAPRLPNKADHLARYRWADLFLDTIYSNAQTTACDALWAGVPLLTCSGNTSYASRVSISLLHAIGLENDGLIVASLEEYQQRAIELATHPEELARIRQKLWTNRLTQPLFDTDRFVRDLEAVLEQMWQQRRNSQGSSLLQQGHSLKKQQRYDEAMAAYQQAIIADPQLAAAHFGLGTIHHYQNRLDQAERCYRRAITCDPAYVDALNNLGAVYHQQQRLAEAIDCFRQSVTLQPDYAEAHFNLGVLMERQQQDQEAIDHYQQAITLKPDYVDAWYNLGVLMQRREEDDTAVAHYQQVLHLRPEHLQAHINLGVLARRQERYRDAASHYRQALKLNPDHANAWYNLGVLMSKQGIQDEEIRCYRQTVALQPDYVAAWYALGGLMQEQNRSDEAAECYRQVVALQPDYTDAIARLVHAEQKVCDWRSFPQLRQRLIEPALAWQEGDGTPAPPPFLFLSLPDITEAEQLTIARNYARRQQQGIQPLHLPPPLPLWERGSGGEGVNGERRLRIGYASYDFRD